jgi:sugar fermentation stimulation protein A
VGINTGLSNLLVREAIVEGAIKELQGYTQVRREVRYGTNNSRIDLLLEGHSSKPACYVEVKNVTLMEDRVAFFPDAVSARGTKHLEELIGVVHQGQRGVLCFCVQREDVIEVRPADSIDPVYGKTLREALKEGVEVMAYQGRVRVEEIKLHKRLPIVCP